MIHVTSQEATNGTARVSEAELACYAANRKKPTPKAKEKVMGNKLEEVARSQIPKAL